MRFLVLIFILFSSVSFAKQIEVANVYTIQVFSSQDKNESKQFAQRFHAYGQPFLMPIRINDQVWYRVYVGVYKNIKDAKEINEKIHLYLEIKDSFVKKLISAD